MVFGNKDKLTIGAFDSNGDTEREKDKHIRIRPKIRIHNHHFFLSVGLWIRIRLLTASGYIRLQTKIRICNPLFPVEQGCGSGSKLFLIRKWIQPVRFLSRIHPPSLVLIYALGCGPGSELSTFGSGFDKIFGFGSATIFRIGSGSAKKAGSATPY